MGFDKLVGMEIRKYEKTEEWENNEFLHSAVGSYSLSYFHCQLINKCFLSFKVSYACSFLIAFEFALKFQVAKV